MIVLSVPKSTANFYSAEVYCKSIIIKLPKGQVIQVGGQGGPMRVTLYRPMRVKLYRPMRVSYTGWSFHTGKNIPVRVNVTSLQNYYNPHSI